MQTNNIKYELVSQRRDACHVTKVWRKILKDDELGVEPYIADGYMEQRLQELESLNEQIEAMTFNPIYRPPWGVGFTTQELIARAKHERVNP